MMHPVRYLEVRKELYHRFSNLLFEWVFLPTNRILCSFFLEKNEPRKSFMPQTQVVLDTIVNATLVVVLGLRFVIGNRAS
jgi:hypothetical protein